MSYSRWGGSTWYSFWSSMSNANVKEDEILSLWSDLVNTKDWKYSELKTWTVETVLENYEGITQDEAEEALQYIKHFLEDVDKEYDTAQREIQRH